MSRPAARALTRVQRADLGLALGRRPLRQTAAQREAWTELIRLRNNARMRINRARIRDDPRKLAEYLERNRREAARYRCKLGGCLGCSKCCAQPCERGCFACAAGWPFRAS